MSLQKESVSEKLVKRDSEELRKNGEQLKAIRLQNKNEWEKELSDLERKTERGMYWVRLDRVRDIIHKALSNREKEIAEEVEKMKPERDETIGFNRGWNVLKGKVLSILKH